jgi:hypothetical protein
MKASPRIVPWPVAVTETQRLDLDDPVPSGQQPQLTVVLRMTVRLYKHQRRAIAGYPV